MLCASDSHFSLLHTKEKKIDFYVKERDRKKFTTNYYLISAKIHNMELVWKISCFVKSSNDWTEANVLKMLMHYASFECKHNMRSDHIFLMKYFLFALWMIISVIRAEFHFIPWFYFTVQIKYPLLFIWGHVMCIVGNSSADSVVFFFFPLWLNVHPSVWPSSKIQDRAQLQSNCAIQVFLFTIIILAHLIQMHLSHNLFFAVSAARATHESFIVSNRV